jgi:tRNA(Ile)-lysidine synthase
MVGHTPTTLARTHAVSMRLHQSLSWLFLRPSVRVSTPAQLHASLSSSAADGRGTSLPAAVQRVLQQNLNVPAGAPLLVSVSGGVDSVALLRVLLALQPRWQWNMHAVHFHHGLRAESDAEEAFVRTLTAEHGIPLHVRRLAPSSWGSREGGEGGEEEGGGLSGVQERTRAWRRAESLALLSTLREDNSQASSGRGDGGGGAIALGHHADDQLETVMMKVLRGCHLSNLHGMRWQEGAFIRPLLGERKSCLQAYLGFLGQDWMEDKSNGELTYKRNRVRLQLMPLLDELAGGADALRARVLALEDQSDQLRSWIATARSDHLRAEPLWQSSPRALSVSRLLKESPLVQDELLHELVRAFEAEAGGADRGADRAPDRPPSSIPFSVLRRLRDQLGRESVEWTLDVNKLCRMRRVGDTLTAVDGGGEAGGMAAAAEPIGDGDAAPGGASHADAQRNAHHRQRRQQRFSVGGTTLAAPAGWSVHARWVRRASDQPATAQDGGDGGGIVLHNLPREVSLEVRRWQPGDRFQPPWRASPSTLVAFLRGQRLSLEDRRAAPVVCLAGTQTVLAIHNPRHVASGFDAPRGGGEERGEEEEAGEKAALWVALDEPRSDPSNCQSETEV